MNAWSLDMKRGLALAGVALGLLTGVRSEVLLWMLDDPVIESWGGTTFNVWKPVLGADGNYYTLNAARVSATDGDGNVVYLSIYDTQTATFDPDVKGIILNERAPARRPSSRPRPAPRRAPPAS